MNFSIKIFNHIKLHKVRYSSIFILVIIILVYLGVYIYIWEYRNPRLEVHFFGLKRGRAVFVRTPENKTILIGGGQNTEVIRGITKVSPFYKRSIDYVFVPSSSPKQIGGLLDVLDRYIVREVVVPKFIATSTVLTELLNVAKSKKIKITEVDKGNEIYTGDKINCLINTDNKIVDNLDICGIKLKVIFPVEDFKYNKTSLAELGLVVTYGRTSVFLLGSLSKTIQKLILKDISNDSFNGENIVEYYHGMTKSKFSNDLFNFINPQFVFSTRETAAHYVSDGHSWYKIK